MSDGDTLALLTSPEACASRSFLPLISLKVAKKRYIKPEGKEKGRITRKVRQIAYASHVDSAIYQYYGHKLTIGYEAALQARGLGDIPVAYRRLEQRKSTVHLANDAFDFIKLNRPCISLAFDVTGFFDNLHHGKLFAEWQAVTTPGVRLPADHYAVYKNITRYSFVPHHIIGELFSSKKDPNGRRRGLRVCTPEEFRTEVRGGGHIHRNGSGIGIPQGSPMSGVLSNMYMLPFDQTISDYANSRNGFARRYSDDVLLILPLPSGIDPGDITREAVAVVETAAEERSLQLNKNKEEVVVFSGDSGRLPDSKQLQYLGLTFDGVAKRIRAQTLSRYYSKISRHLNRCKFRKSRNEGTKIWRKKLNELYTHTGKQTFISYAYKAADVCKSAEIRAQVARHPKIINEMIERPLRGKPRPKYISKVLRSMSKPYLKNRPRRDQSRRIVKPIYSFTKTS
jgi:hypothetical protein